MAQTWTGGGGGRPPMAQTWTGGWRETGGGKTPDGAGPEVGGAEGDPTLAFGPRLLQHLCSRARAPFCSVGLVAGWSLPSLSQGQRRRPQP